MAVSSKTTGWRRDGDAARLDMYYKGTRVAALAAAHMSSAVPFAAKRTVTPKTSGGNTNISVAELLGGFISDTTATGANAATLPTGSALCTALPGYAVGDSFQFTYGNPGNQTVTITAATNATIVGTATIATLNVKSFLVVITAANTYVLYSMGTAVM